MMRATLTTARTLKAKRRKCFRRWGRDMICCERRRRRTAEKFLGMAFLRISRWIRMGRIPAARPKRKKGFEKARFIFQNE
jgi:hypothetical protein